MPWETNCYSNVYQRGKPYPLKKRYEVEASYFSTRSVAEAGRRNMASFNCAKKIVDVFLNHGTCDPKQQGGEHAERKVTDWQEVYIDALLVVNPTLYLSEIQERLMVDLQLTPAEVPSLSAICKCLQNLNITRKKIIKLKMERFTVDNRDLKHDDAFNTTWPPALSIDKCCQVTSLSIERTDHHVLLKASSCLRCLISKEESYLLNGDIA